MARAFVEACVNEVMSAQADAMCEETGTSRNGFRERRLETQVGAITLGIPKLREGAVSATVKTTNFAIAL